MPHTRRSLIAAAGLAAAPGAARAMAGNPPYDIHHEPGFSGWFPPPYPSGAPLDAAVIFENGSRASLGQWMNGRPTLLLLWALWCAPCLQEKQPEDTLLRRLRAAGSRTQILALQSYDPKPIGEARAMLERLGAHSLPLARASPEAEAKLVYLTGGQSGTAHSTVTLPAMVLVSGDGREIGRHNGRMPPLPGRPNWFSTQAAFELLMVMGKTY